jgi:hypothetical protein
LKYRQDSLAQITASEIAADVLLEKIALEKLRDHFRIPSTLQFPLPVAAMALGSKERSRVSRVEEAAGPTLHRFEEIDPPSDPMNLPRTRGDEQRRWRRRRTQKMSLLRKPSLDPLLPLTVHHGRVSGRRGSMIWLPLIGTHIG